MLSRKSIRISIAIALSYRHCTNIPSLAQCDSDIYPKFPLNCDPRVRGAQDDDDCDAAGTDARCGRRRAGDHSSGSGGGSGGSTGLWRFRPQQTRGSGGDDDGRNSSSSAR